MRHMMKRNLIGLAVVPTLAATLAWSVQAQAQAPGQDGRAATAAAPSGAQGQTQGNYRAVRASQVMDADVRNAQGQDIGQIEDMVIDTRDGSVRYAVLSVDPGWFQSDRLYSLPADKLRWGNEREEIVLQGVSREQLEQGGIERSEWNPQLLNDADRFGRIDRAWAASPARWRQGAP